MHKQTDGGYEQVLEYRWGRMGGEYDIDEQGNCGGGVAAGRMRARSCEAAEVEGVTTVSRKRKGGDAGSLLEVSHAAC